MAYTNRDTYFGPYAAGAKAGTGLYVAANGAGYVGQYAAGKRSGFGLMILPDGGLYKGGFKEDKFEGQVGRLQWRPGLGFDGVGANWVRVDAVGTMEVRLGW